MAKHSILVVEDHPAMRELLRLHLGGAGYQVILAEDAVVAGRAILRSQPSLMIVDANLPYMSGIDFAVLAMADTTLPYIPTLLISGSDIEVRADALGIAVLKKPFLTHQLLDKVAEQLSGAPEVCAQSSSPRRETLSSSRHNAGKTPTTL